MTRHHRTSLREELLAAAVAHTRRGWHVFPLRRGGKRPALHGEDLCPRTGSCRDAHQGWEQRATTDPARIQSCWNYGPPFNIGVACGPSGILVIDLDMPKPGAVPPAEEAALKISNGADAFATLCQRHGQPWPSQTFAVFTPSGGMHLYFTVPAHTSLRTTAGRLGWCIDTRGAGGYVVAPGSVVGGRRYGVLNPAASQPLPGWLAALLAEPVSDPCGLPAAPPATRCARAALDRETGRVATAPQGQRNDTLNRAAFALGQLAAAGLLPATLAHTALAQAARHAGLDRDPGCGLCGIDRTIRSGLTAGARKPRTRLA